ncbi:hypothetical protein GCM10022267_83450 [Lentzea roselyniae]|uniref:Uncharacterized protein n=1 Tax=Lentzea roselyniae TaxID=531940 RepID=A0ABP7C910_9PSEU
MLEKAGFVDVQLKASAWLPSNSTSCGRQLISGVNIPTISIAQVRYTWVEGVVDPADAGSALATLALDRLSPSNPAPIIAAIRSPLRLVVLAPVMIDPLDL